MNIHVGNQVTNPKKSGEWERICEGGNQVTLTPIEGKLPSWPWRRGGERAWGWVGEIERLRVRACRVDLWVGGKGELPRRWGGGRAWRGGRRQTKRVKMRVGRWGNESESKGEGEGRLTELIRFRVWLVSGFIYIWVIFIILFYTGWVRVWVRGRYA